MCMNKLDNSRPLDVWIWANKPEVKEATSFIYNKFFANDEKFTGKTIKYHLRTIITDLFVAKIEDKTKYIAISRSRNDYIENTRLKKIFLKYRYTIHILDTLENNGYIEQHKGFHSKFTGRLTRIRATEKLVRLFRKYKRDTNGENTLESGKIFKRNIPVILRNQEKKDIDYDINNKLVKNMIINVNRINKMLQKHVIDLESPDIWDEIIQSDSNLGHVRLNNKYKRVFNGSFEYGGRFYGHWSQQIPSRYRKYITIDGKDTVEADYSCLHLSMLYRLENIDIPSGDLYRLNNVSDKFRSIIKFAVNISINAKTEKQAVQALNVCYKEHQVNKYIVGISPKEMISKVMNKHYGIKKYFCTGHGLRLQALDSEIAESIMLNFAQRGECVLSIHDSFITSTDNKDVLIEMMRDRFYEHFSSYSRIKIK